MRTGILSQMNVITFSLIWRQTHKEQFISSVYPYTSAKIWEQTNSFSSSPFTIFLYQYHSGSISKWWFFDSRYRFIGTEKYILDNHLKALWFPQQTHETTGKKTILKTAMSV